MAGSNFGLKYDDDDNKDNLIALLVNRRENLKTFFDSVVSGQNMIKNNVPLDYYEIIFRQIDSKFLSDIRIDKNSLIYTEDEKQRDFFNKQVNYLPLITDSEILGKPINVTINKGVVINIPVRLKDKTFYLMKKINEQNKFLVIRKKHIVSFDDTYKFYFKDIKNFPHILAIKQLDNNTYKKEVFNLNGLKLNSIEDKIESNNSVSRKIKDKYFIEIEDNEIVYSEDTINLRTIKSSEILNKEKGSFIANLNIGVIDLETYTQSETGKARVYSAGLYSFVNTEAITFYIDKDTMDSDKVMADLFSVMFKAKYKGIKWYCHNFGGFDSIFLVNHLEKQNNDIEIKKSTELNINKKSNKLNNNKQLDKAKKDMKFLDRKGSILKLIVTSLTTKTRDTFCGAQDTDSHFDTEKVLEKSNIRHTLGIRDSLGILTDSLRNLCKSYGVDKSIEKGDFPHDFANENTLFYIGKTPKYKYYEDLDKEIYNESKKDNWSFKEESLSYLKKDFYNLYEVLKKANENFFKLFNRIQMTDSITASSLVLKIFMKDYSKQGTIPLINNRNIFNDIKKAYYVGRTEVYKPYGKILNLYDVNSLYPFGSSSRYA